jgi:hypothetical protein
VWMLIVEDHFTKYLWAKEFKTKDSGPIAEFLYATFTNGVCVPERWHADNGGEFKSYHIDAVRSLLTIRDHAPGTLLPYTHSMPRNPQCQGLVERANRTLKSRMHKNMENNGYDANADKVFDWVPYLHAAVMAHNRDPVKLYGKVCPSELMTGMPPEAPDHQNLTPAELNRLHEFCAQKQRQAAKGREIKEASELPEFQPDDIVHVLQLDKKSHADKKFKGAKRWTGRAIIVSRSETSCHRYQIQWISDGLIEREKAGTISRTLWLSWRLKPAAREDSDPITADAPAADATAISKKLRASASSRSSTSHLGSVQNATRISDVQTGAPTTPGEAIAKIASRSSPSHLV